MDSPPVTEHASQEPDQPRRYGRGLFLATVAGGISSLYWGKAAWDHVTGVVSPVASAVAPGILPTGGWRIYTISGHMPVFDPAAWRLKIGGLVEQPISLNYDELRALPRVKQVSTFHCVTGWTVDNVHWGGVRLGDVLAAAKPHSTAGALEFVSMEVPYTDYLTLQQASLHDVMLAYEMDGKPLPQEHGAPVRLIIPEMYGYKNVKWLGGINLVPKEQLGYWEQLGYDQDAWVGRSNGYGA
jgi:DMSO/TMAO reductase YedYZ molybdopterin-dependent catalytic subunit